MVENLSKSRTEIFTFSPVGVGCRSSDELEIIGPQVIGASWEGFVIENLLAVAPPHTMASFYRTARGAEIDLVLEMGGKHGIWAIEIKHSPSASFQKGNRIALDDIQPSRAFLVHSGTDRFPKGESVEAIGLAELMQELQRLE